MRRRRVDDDARRGHQHAVMQRRITIARVDRSRMPHPAVMQNLVAQPDCLLPNRWRCNRRESARAFRSRADKSRPTPPTSAIRQRVIGGTLMPAHSASVVAGLPTIFGFRRRCGVTTSLASCSACADSESMRLARRTVRGLLYRAAHRRPPPVPRRRWCRNRSISRREYRARLWHIGRAFDKSGTLPGPTPKAGLPDE